ncbi:MAG: hypothetical protein KA354_14135 [Phycisphaerae bacterium]|nr:hypothetical protein [Phycisphaerae bacterium]
MRRWCKWLPLLAMLVPGVTLSSCMTDIKDAATIGMMDFVSYSVGDSLKTAMPFPTWIGDLLNSPQVGE